MTAYLYVEYVRLLVVAIVASGAEPLWLWHELQVGCWAELDGGQAAQLGRVRGRIWEPWAAAGTRRPQIDVPAATTVWAVAGARRVEVAFVWLQAGSDV